jgi:hypothetical protein
MLSTALRSWNVIKTYLWLRPYEFVTHIWGLGRNLFQIKDPDDDRPIETCPRVDTVMASLLCLGIFLITSVFAVTHLDICIMRGVVIVNTLLALSLWVILVIDVRTRKLKAIVTCIRLTNLGGSERKIRRSLLNTVLTVFLTIVVLTAIYCRTWYPGMNDIVVRQEADSIVS